MKSKKILIALGLGWLTLLSSQVCYALTEQKPPELPVEQGIAEEKVKTGNWQENNEPLTPQLPIKQKREVLPSIFDPRGTSLETPVKNQGSVGLCWAYSGTDVLSLAKVRMLGSLTNFSPNFWNYTFASNAYSDGFNPNVRASGWGLDEGGITKELLITSNLGRNPVRESIFPTAVVKGQNQPILSQDYQAIVSKADTSFEVTDTFILKGISLQSSEADMRDKTASIKSMIKNYGSMSFSQHDTYSLDKDKAKKYAQMKDGKYTSHVPVSAYSDIKADGNVSSITQRLNTNHALTIIGWDDTFDKSMFKVQPKQNGAFIVKNSWGTTFGDKGYYYVSYEDIYLVDGDLTTVKVKNSDNEQLNAYVTTTNDDGRGLNKVEEHQMYVANSFEVKEKEKTLTHVGFYNEYRGLKYEVYYLPKELTVIPDGNLHWADDTIRDYKKIGEGTFTEVGMQRMTVASQDVQDISAYTIVVKVVNAKEISEKTGEGFFFPLQKVSEQADGTKLVLKSGKSFMSLQSHETWLAWEDISNLTNSKKAEKANAYVNAYVETEGSEKVTPVYVEIKNKSSHTYILHNYPETLKTEISSDNYTSSDLKWTSSDTSILTVDKNGVVTGKGSGKVTVRVELKDNATVFDTIDMTVDDHGDEERYATLAQVGTPVRVTNDYILPAGIKCYGEYYEQDVLKYEIKDDGDYTVFLNPQGNFSALAEIKVNGKVRPCDSPRSSMIYQWWASNQKVSTTLKKGDEVFVTIWGGGVPEPGNHVPPILPQLKEYSLFTLSKGA